MSARPSRPTRRAFLTGAAAVLVTACQGTPTPVETHPPPGRTPAMAASPQRIRATVRPSLLPAVQPWRPDRDEVEPEVKIAAVRVVEALGTVTEDDVGGAAERLARVGADPRLAERAGPLVPPSAPAITEVVYPQYGGLTDEAASVMTIVRQTWVRDGRPRDRTVTVDVRLRKIRGRWEVTGLRPAEPANTGSRRAGRAARLSDHPRIDLPDAALADLAAGAVDDVVVDALLDLGRAFAFSVCVLRSGHPRNVFGTDRMSNHTRGRAVDIWALDGRSVVTMSVDDPVLLSFIAAAKEIGSDEIGAPVDPDGPGGVHFTDHVHRDHIHIGFRY